MSHAADELLATDIDAYLERHEHKSMLRFITCGSVDDGKSTLIGRLLYDSKMVFEDQLAALGGGLEEGRHAGRRDRLRPAGRRPGRRARAGHHHRRRLPLLLHRAAQVHRRRHPRPRAVHPQHGHRRLHRRPGGDPDRRPQGRADPDPAPQLPGVAAGHPPHRAGDQQDGPGRLLARGVRPDRGGLPRVRPPDRPRTTSSPSRSRPCAGDNITEHSAHTPWYTGPTLIGHLETVEVERPTQDGPFRMPVQWVNRPNLDFRGFSGEIVGGTVRAGRHRAGDPVRTRERGLPDRHLRRRPPGGGRRASRSPSPLLTRSTSAAVTCWLPPRRRPVSPTSSRPTWCGCTTSRMLAGRPYLLKLGTRTVGATLAQPKYKVNVNTLEHAAAKTLELNEIGVCNLNLDRPIAFDPYEREPRHGRLHPHRPDHQRHGRRRAAALRPAAGRQRPLAGGRGRPVGAGRAQAPAAGGAVVHRPVRGGQVDDRQHRRDASCTPRAGTRTCSTATTCVTASTATSASPTADRVENIRRIAEVAALMADAGLIVLVAFISPLPRRAAAGPRADRRGRVRRGVGRHPARRR